MSKLNVNKEAFRFLYMFLIFNIITCFSGINDLSAQSKKKKKKEATPFIDQIWLGGGVNLNFNSGYYNGFQSNVFTFGLSPMAGYKLNSFLSIGPRISFDWTVAKFSDFTGVYKYNSVDFGLGVFARAKFLSNFFAHTEYSQLNETYTDGSTNGNKLITSREWRDIFLLGLGYHSNSPLAYEIYVNYNFLEDDNSIRVPIVYRAGITWHF